LKIDKNHPETTVVALRDILADSGRIYERGVPVRVVFDEEVNGSAIHRLDPNSLALEAHFACQPYVMVKKGEEWVESDTALPPPIARMYLGWKGEWNLPPFNGVTSTPLLSEDGSIRTAIGYDVATGVWCDRMPDVSGMVPPNPTREQAAAALFLVRSAFKTFCFSDAITVDSGKPNVRFVDLRHPARLDESSFLVSLLGSVCRASLWLAPGYLYRAAQHSGSGAGKGKLVRCACEVAHGRQPSAIPPGGSHEEQEKRVSSALLEGGPAVLFDNFNNVTLRSPSLESALTERPAKVRQFRTLDLVTLNALCSVFVTGNGILLAQDIVRRFIPTELDAGIEDPERRPFDGDIVAEIAARRSELLAALLTVWRWGRQNKRLKRGIALGSYEQWCSWVRDPLLDLGCQDPVKRVLETKRRDPYRQMIGTLFVTWWSCHGDNPVTAYGLVDNVQKIIDPQGRGRQFIVSALLKLVGTRLAGFVLTRQEAPGQWGADTYALKKTGEKPEAEVNAEPYAPYAPGPSQDDWGTSEYINDGGPDE
jgi:hypothetical protein